MSVTRKIKIGIFILLSAIMMISTIGVCKFMSFAEGYSTITVEYKFSDGKSAFDSYKAVYTNGANVNVVITNPIIPGYKPVNSTGPDADPAPKTEIIFNAINEDKTITVYYIPDVVNYRVRYYFQNINDDLYTEELSLDKSFTDKTGITGEYPQELENIKFEGFSTLFHEPDVIAADGSTIFQIYYDRNYTLINFNLNGGYGVEPVYAKYQSTFNIPEPQKRGYTFKGWQDKNGNISKFTSGTVPAEDVSYTAVWEATNTTYTVIYWTENANDDNYSYAGKEIKNALSGTTVTGSDSWTHADKAYYVYDNTMIQSEVVDGDGSTIINVYYKRKLYTLKFYYARKKITNTPSNLTSLTSGESYNIYSTRAENYLTSSKYNNNNYLAFSNKEIFKLEKADNQNGYYITNEDGYFLSVGNGTSVMTSTPTITYVEYNTDGYWTLRDANDYYLNDWAGAHNYAAGWNGSGASTDIGSRWYIYSAFSSCQISTFTNNFNATLGDASNAPGIILNDTTWCTINNNQLPVLSERYQKTQGKEKVGDDIYYYFTLTAKYEEKLTDRWPLNRDLGNVQANNRWCFFGAWNPTQSNYYSNHKNQFAGNTTIKGEYQKLDQFIMIENHPEQTIIPFLGFWTNSTNPSWNIARQWVYNLYVPLLEGDTTDITYNGVNYKRHAAYSTFDTNDAYNEQTPTALDGFTYLGVSWNRNANYTFEHSGGSTSMTSYNANFYYRRNSYSLVFNNIDKYEKEINVPYETPLSQYNFTPEYPDESQRPFYEFAGWYTTSDCLDGTEFDLSSIMPANNVILFAKWEKVKHNVIFYTNYNDYVSENNKLHTAMTYHNELLYTSDIPDPNTIEKPEPDAQFAGWYYFDQNKVRFDPYSIPITKNISLFAEWSSKTTAKYKIKYVEQGTSISVSDDTEGTAFIGKTKTFQAKGGNELNESHKWSEGSANWWPIIPSHSISIAANNNGEYEPNTFIFEYIKKNSVFYTVRYVDSQTGVDLDPSKTKIISSNYSVVTENFIRFDGYIPDKVSKTIVLAAYATEEEEKQNNVITFYYTKNETEALYQVNHHIQSIDNPSEYSLYKTDTKTVKLNTEIDTSISKINISGFYFVENKTVINGSVETGKGIADGNKLIIDLYYDRLRYGYTVRYLDYETNTELYKENFTDDSVKQILGSKVTVTSPETFMGQDDTKYIRIGKAERTLEIRADSGEPLTLNVINIYYQKKNIYTIKYEAVAFPDTTDNFGTVSLLYENVSEGDPIQGATAIANNKKYKFIGWYQDKECTIPVDPLLTSGENKTVFKPKVANDIIYYAGFALIKGSLTITQNGGSENESFLYMIKETESDDPPLIVAVNGGKSVTVNDIPAGNYTITEITDWNWRYDSADATEKTVNVTEKNIPEVTFENTLNNKKWLGGEKNDNNHFDTLN